MKNWQQDWLIITIWSKLSVVYELFCSEPSTELHCAAVRNNQSQSYVFCIIFGFSVKTFIHDYMLYNIHTHCSNINNQITLIVWFNMVKMNWWLMHWIVFTFLFCSILSVISCLFLIISRILRIRFRRIVFIQFSIHFSIRLIPSNWITEVDIHRTKFTTRMIWL